ncbi:MAG: hypothetical protein ACXVY8_10455 [Gaiellaceae bacterium]
MPEPERVRIEIGFEGSQIMGTLVTLKAADTLEQALAKGDAGTVTLESEEGDALIVVLAKVVYVKRFSRASRVGF